MEKWPDVLSCYPRDASHKEFGKVLLDAETLLAGDLAPFEAEWLVHTLLLKPVNIFSVLSTRCMDELWSKSLTDSFKIISKIIEKYEDVIMKYNNDIVERCTQQYIDVHTRKESLNCLKMLIQTPSGNIDRDVANKIIITLEEATNLKAPLALLVGSICRHRPELVGEEFTKIWRIYLIMLQSRNKTDSIANAVLHGIDGLLANFGVDIPMDQMNIFYESLSRAYVSTYTEASIMILNHHAHLFKERLAADVSLRQYLWNINSKNIIDTLCYVYKVIFDDLTKDNVESMIKSEVEPRLACRIFSMKNAATKIMIYAKISKDLSFPSLNCYLDLEYQLMGKKLSYQEAQSVHWSIETNVGDQSGQSLLLTAIKYFDNLPMFRRSDIVVNGIYKANNYVRKASLVVLIKLNLHEGFTKRYTHLWRVLLDNVRGSNVQKAVVVFDDTVKCILEMLGDVSMEKNKIKSIITLLINILSFHKQEMDSQELCTALASNLLHLAIRMNTAVWEFIVDEQNQYYNVERFQDDTVLSLLLSLLDSSEERKYTLDALKVIFFKSNTESKMLYYGVKKLDILLSTAILDSKDISVIIDRLKMLQIRKLKNDKNERMLHREITVFLSKYSNLATQENFNDNLYLLKLKNKITLNLDVEGVNYKIDLQRILQICLECNHLESLHTLLVIFTANLGSNLSILEDTQDATLRLIYATFKAQNRDNSFEVDVVPALVMCNTARSVQLLMSFICQEKELKVKILLSQALEVLLRLDPQGGEDLTRVISERGVVMIQSDDESIMESGLYIIKSILYTLKQNDDLTKELLPKLLVLTSTVKESAILDSLSNIFIDKLDIFKIQDIEEIIQKILNIYLNKVGNSIQKNLELFKTIFERNKYEFSKFLNIILSNLDIELNKRINVLHILSISSNIFGNKKITEILEENHFNILIEVFRNENRLENDLFEINAKLLFLTAFSKELFCFKAEAIITYFGKILEMMTPNIVLQLKDTISASVNQFQALYPNTIILLKPHFNIWCQNMDLNTITLYLNDMTEFDKHLSELILSLRVFSDILNEPVTIPEDWTDLIVKSQSEYNRYFLSDILVLSEKSLTDEKFEELLTNNCQFVRKYMNVYFKRVIGKPNLVNKDILLDILDVFVSKYKCQEDYLSQIMELVESVWPECETTSFNDKINLLSKIFAINNSCIYNSTPCQWGFNIVISEQYNLEEKIKLIKILPIGEGMGVYYKKFVSNLPTRLSEMSGEFARIFKALLDALANNADLELFDIISTLAGGDDTKGWWDHAFVECMSCLATNDNILQRANQRAATSLSSGVCRRVLLPLLRQSTQKVVESYLTAEVTRMLTTLSRGCSNAVNSDVYVKCLQNYATVLSVLHVAIDKLPEKSLEFGRINAISGNPKPWYFTEEVCKHCINLSGKVKMPNEPTEAVKQAYIWFQSSAYNCLVSAICKRKPRKKVYTHVFNVQLWAKIVDNDEYEFELKAYAEKVKQSRSAEESTQSSNSTLTRTRTRLFLKTLSEDPFKYDMIPQDGSEDNEEEDISQDQEDNILNTHGCLTALCNLLEQSSRLEHTEWRDTLAVGLVGDMPVNAKWLLAQAICNVQDILKPHSQVLTPGLLTLISNTPKTIGGVQVLHNLHLIMLETIISWGVPLQHNAHLDRSICYLISTLLFYNNKYYICRRLLNVLNKILELYGTVVNVGWEMFVGHEDLSTSSKYLLPILEKLLKNGVKMPQILPKIFGKLDLKQWVGKYKVAELFGMAIGQADSVTRDEYIEKFKKILKDLRNNNCGDFVKVLFYAQKHCWKCCDIYLFRQITDLAPKIEKSKCLTILSTHLEHAVYDEFYLDMIQIISLLDLIQGDMRREAMKIAEYSLSFVDLELKSSILRAVVLNCRSSSKTVRSGAYNFVLKAFEDLIKPDCLNTAKRRTVDSSSILDTIDSNDEYTKLILEEVSKGMLDKDGDISNIVCEGVDNSLSKDMAIRFAELFYLVIYLSNNKDLDMSVCGSILIKYLFKHLREQDSFNNTKLRDEGLSTSQQDIDIYSLTAGVFVSSNSKTTTRAESRQIDVQTPVVKLFDTLVELAKINFQVCQELCLQIMKCLNHNSRRFDFATNISKQLAVILAREPNPVTPFVLEASRMFLDNKESVQRFELPVTELKHAVHGTDSALYVNILYEDILLRHTGRSQFEYSFSSFLEEDEPMVQEFDIDELMSAFGQLSNWDDLTFQDRRRVEYTLPTLWVEGSRFSACAKTYYDDRRSREEDFKSNTFWFNKMAESYLDSTYQNRVEWLKVASRWPTRQFAVAAILETIDNCNKIRDVTEIKTTDCLAEWAGRLMLRSLSSNLEDSASSIEDDRVSVNELLWCTEANRRNLPYTVLQCVERNTPKFSEEDVLPWLHQKVQARRTIALRREDHEELKKILEVAEQQVCIFSDKSTSESNVSMKTIILQLTQDLQLLSPNKVDAIMNELSNYYKNHVISGNVKKSLKQAFDIAMSFYNELWNTYELTQNEIITKMLETIEKILENNIIYDSNVLFAILLNRLTTFDGVLELNTAELFVKMLSRTINNLDSFTINKITQLQHIFPGRSFHELQLHTHTNTCAEYFANICDPSHLLLMYCKSLRMTTDQQEWQQIYERMINKFFDNKHGGSDFETLHTIKMKLIDLNTKDKVEMNAILDNVISELRTKEPRKQLRLNQISPQLCSDTVIENQREDLRKLLCLPPGVYVVKFVKQVSVFTDSIRRPCTLTVYLSDGYSVRYLCKSGETLLLDASVQRCFKILPQFCTVATVRSYNVIPTSEDSAIIEYLDDHVRVREMIADKININSVLATAGSEDDSLILSPSRALEQYRTITKSVEPYLLRSAIEDRCASAQELISKKQQFMNTLSTMTIITWLFGIGDRHLENIMCSIRDGCVCAVDLASAFQYGSKELPPARLTANFMAVCDVKVLESRLQCILSSLRSSSVFYEAFIKISFYWKPLLQIQHIESILQGTSTSIEITRKVLETSNKTNKQAYIRLLDQVSEMVPVKDTYTVEEQISCLLLHCTSPKILSVCPRTWESWV